jgi:DNA topoisomerase-1
MPKKIPDLVYVTDQQPGYTRIKKENSFVYIDEKQLELSEDKIIQRITDLVIPPIWKDVWICKDENGHLQSTGRDGKNRKQYIYHPLWTARNQQNKFSRLKEFGLAVPTIRKQVEEDLSASEWTKRKVLALVVHLLDDYFLRVGNPYYTDQNESYGITTLRRKHIDESKKKLSLEYKAKSNRIRKIDITNKRLAKLVREISELPGYEIFRYQVDSRTWNNIDSSDVNEYIQMHIGSHFSAKDFRTWGGTKLTISLYEEAIQKVQENKRRQFEPTLVRLIAQRLGNKLSTCREYYIHPEVLSAAEHHKIPKEPDLKFQDMDLDEEEKLVLTILN